MNDDDDKRACDACAASTPLGELQKCGSAPMWADDHLLCRECAERGCEICEEGRHVDPASGRAIDFTSRYP